MTIKRAFIIVFTILFSFNIISMEIAESDISNVELPHDVEPKIFTYLDLQSLGRIKSVCQRYNNWIDFENNILGPHAYCITQFLSQNFDYTEKALISAAHSEKIEFMQNILFHQQTVKERYRKYCLSFIRNEFASEDDTVLLMKDYVNAYKGIVNHGWKNDEKVLEQAIKDGNIYVARIILSNDYYKEKIIPEKEQANLLKILLNAYYEENLIEEKNQEDILRNAVVMQKKRKRKDCLELLLSGKIKKDIQFNVNSSSEGLYPLYVAVSNVYKNKDISIVKLLLEYGARVNQENSYYCDYPTALHKVVTGENLDLVKLLLSYGADINKKDKKGKTPLMSACRLIFHTEFKNKEVISYLLNVPNICINEQDDQGKTALMYSSKSSECWEVIQLLLDKGADATIQDNKGQILLHKVAMYGCKEIMKLLLEYNIMQDINCADKEGCTPLMCAVNSENKNAADIVSLLLNKGADANIQNNEGQTVLHKAATYGYQEIVKLLLERKVIQNINCIDKNGLTPLMCAIKNSVNITDTTAINNLIVLLQNNADISKQDNDGKTILHRIIEKAHLCNIGPLFNILILEISQNNKLKSDFINMVDKQGCTALMYACKRGFDFGINLLLNNNADVHIKDIHGATALHWAAKNGMVDCAQLLLNYKAIVNAVDNNGNTPLHYIAMAQMEDTEENTKKISAMINLLLKYGANREQKNLDWNVPFFAALEAGNYLVVKYFMSDHNSRVYYTLSNEGKTPRDIRQRLSNYTIYAYKTPLSFLSSLAIKKPLTEGQIKIMYDFILSDMDKMLHEKAVQHNEETRRIQQEEEKKRIQQEKESQEMFNVVKSKMEKELQELKILNEKKTNMELLYRDQVRQLTTLLSDEQKKIKSLENEKLELTNTKNSFNAKISAIKARVNKLVWYSVGVSLASVVAMLLLKDSNSMQKAWGISILLNFILIGAFAENC